MAAAVAAAGHLDPVDRSLAAVAVTLAGQLDKLGRAVPKETPADRARRTADVVKVSRELRGLLRDLPLRTPGTPPAAGTGGPEEAGGDSSDDDPPAAGGPDSVDAELAGIVGAGATLGDPTYA